MTVSRDLLRLLVLLYFALILAASTSKLVATANAQEAPVSQEKALEKHQGVWIGVSFQRDGKETPGEIVESITRTVEKDHVIWKRNGKSFAGTSLEVFPKEDPATIDVIADGGPSKGKRVLGIYKFEDDKIILCMADPDQPRPTLFKAEAGTKTTLMVFRREKKLSDTSEIKD